MPGISKNGGIASGVAALAITILLLGIVVGGASAATNGGVPLVDDENDPVAKPTQTPTPEARQTPGSSPVATVNLTRTITPNQSPTEGTRSDFEKFESQYRNRLKKTAENATLVPVPVLAMEYRERGDGTTELWVVYWECDNLPDTKAQRVTVTIYFGNTVGNYNGEQPDQARIYSVNSLESYGDSMTYIPSSKAHATYVRNISVQTYTNTWGERLREPTPSEQEIAFQMVVEDSGRTVAEEAFKEHYPFEESDKGCHTIES